MITDRRSALKYALGGLLGVGYFSKTSVQAEVEPLKIQSHTELVCGKIQDYVTAVLSYEVSLAKRRGCRSMVEEHFIKDVFCSRVTTVMDNHITDIEWVSIKLLENYGVVHFTARVKIGREFETDRRSFKSTFGIF